MILPASHECNVFANFKLKWQLRGEGTRCRRQMWARRAESERAANERCCLWPAISPFDFRIINVSFIPVATGVQRHGRRSHDRSVSSRSNPEPAAHRTFQSSVAAGLLWRLTSSVATNYIWTPVSLPYLPHGKYTERRPSGAFYRAEGFRRQGPPKKDQGAVSSSSCSLFFFSRPPLNPLNIRPCIIQITFHICASAPSN